MQPTPRQLGQRSRLSTRPRRSPGLRARLPLLFLVGLSVYGWWFLHAAASVPKSLEAAADDGAEAPLVDPGGSTAGTGAMQPDVQLGSALEVVREDYEGGARKDGGPGAAAPAHDSEPQAASNATDCEPRRSGPRGSTLVSDFIGQTYAELSPTPPTRLDEGELTLV